MSDFVIEESMFLQSAKRTIHDNGTAFGYSVVMTGTFTILSSMEGSPENWEMLLAVLGAAVTFSILGFLNFGLKGGSEEKDETVAILGNSLNFFSITGAVAAVMLLSVYADKTVAWITGPIISTLVFVFITSLELAAVRWFKKKKKEKIIKRNFLV